MPTPTEIASYNPAVFRPLLQRLSKQRLIEFVERNWGRADTSLSEISNKKTLVARITSDLLINKITHQQVAELELLFCQHSTRKKWRALRLISAESTGDVADGFTKPILNDPQRWQLRLSAELDSFFKHFTLVQLLEGHLWVRICIYDGVPPTQLPPPSNSIYFVYFLHSEYMLASPVKEEYKQFVMQALMETLSLREIQEWHLSGTHVNSLAELLLCKDSQGPFQQYRLGKVDTNPLQPPPPKRRKLTHTTAAQVTVPTLVNEDARHDLRVRETVEREFGSETIPQLPTLDYEIVDRFRGEVTIAGQVQPLEVGGPITINVHFEGTSVLQGLCELVTHGLAVPPLPDYLTGVVSSGRNEFVLVNRAAAR